MRENGEIMAVATPYARRLLKRLAVIISLAILSLICWHWLGNMDVAYSWHWNRVWRYLGRFDQNGLVAGPLLKGVAITIGITFYGLIISLASGLFFAALRLSPWIVCVICAKIYVAIWRNTPLLLQLFITYFLIAPLLGLSPFFAAAISLGFFEGAYFAEILRSGILGIHKNQWEAGLSLGFSLSQTFLLLILPQAFRRTLPAMVNQTVALLKDSSLTSAIAVADLTLQSQAVVSETFLAFEVWLLAGGIYLILALFFAIPGLWLEKHLPLEKTN